MLYPTFARPSFHRGAGIADSAKKALGMFLRQAGRSLMGSGQQAASRSFRDAPGGLDAANRLTAGSDGSAFDQGQDRPMELPYDRGSERNHVPLACFHGIAWGIVLSVPIWLVIVAAVRGFLG